ncbi:MAG: hypothetical protein OCD76_10510, partial [Reichenbachiella sp.]
MNKFFIFVLFLFCQIQVSCQTIDQQQKESLAYTVKFGLMGDWQKGNLNQWSIMPELYANLYTHEYYLQIGVSYNYLFTEG